MNEIEYTSLRAEVIFRLKNRHQIIYWTIVLIGAFMSFSFSNGMFFFLAFCPPIVMLISFLWGHNEIKIRQLGNFISEVYENEEQGFHWEKWRVSNLKNSNMYGLNLIYLIPFFLFVISQVVLVLLGTTPLVSKTGLDFTSKPAFQIEETIRTVVLIVDGIAFVSTFALWLRIVRMNKTQS